MASFDDVELAARVSDELAKMSYEDKIAVLADRGIAADCTRDVDTATDLGSYAQTTIRPSA